MEKTVLYEVEDSIAIITLNRPERRNSITQDLLVNLFNSFEEVIKDDNIKVAILTGNGKSFCSGIDLSVIGTDNLGDPRGDGKTFAEILSACEKPVIGAINGHAITGGFEMALNCDFLIASENALFADTHTIVGIHPGWGATQWLQEAAGQRMAKQMSFTGKFITAQTALQHRLVNEVVPPDQLMERAIQIAADICDVNQDILKKVKKLIEYRNGATLKDSLAEEKKRFEIDTGDKLSGK
ncbi:MAG: enoyl-CoA hydratase [Desulfobacterales bacterium]|nr:enoyl-CoA hydratase [Desulfobacteraceae bacterium]MBT4365180.1 enoyl-CoA hydratase [Desulfobacteraceae bacterium]MBT7086803.1 enoyl-CoA hydratase [Desulfobacterales bacterium]MBT7698105.1 enoyl-CoA hydratase [Desulfobacterales bacterium]